MLSEARRTARKACDLVASSQQAAASPGPVSHRISRPTWDQDATTGEVITRTTEDILATAPESPGAVSNGSLAGTDAVSTPAGHELAGGARVSSPLDAGMSEHGLPQVTSPSWHAQMPVNSSVPDSCSYLALIECLVQSSKAAIALSHAALP